MVQSRQLPSGSGGRSRSEKECGRIASASALPTTIGQARQWIETVDGDLVAGGDLRPQAGQPQPSSRPCQKVTTSGRIRVASA
jgi:hypothetical protein